MLTYNMYSNVLQSVLPLCLHVSVEFVIKNECEKECNRFENENQNFEVVRCRTKENYNRRTVYLKKNCAPRKIVSLI